MTVLESRPTLALIRRTMWQRSTGYCLKARPCRSPHWRDPIILRYVNPAFCRLTGKTKDELIGKPFRSAKIDRVLFESSPLPVAALAGPNHTALRQSCLLPTDRQDQR